MLLVGKARKLGHDDLPHQCPGIHPRIFQAETMGDDQGRKVDEVLVNHVFAAPDRANAREALTSMRLPRGEAPRRIPG